MRAVKCRIVGWFVFLATVLAFAVVYTMRLPQRFIEVLAIAGFGVAFVLLLVGDATIVRGGE